MANTHLKTAHAWGVQQALEQIGYTSIEDVQKQAAALGLVEPSKTASAAPADPLAELFRTLSK